MSADATPSPVVAVVALPENPDLRHLRDEARALVQSGDASTHAKALFAVARRYGFASWPKLKAEVESRQEVGQLKAAIDTGEWGTVREMLTRNPELHRAPLGYGKSGPLTWLAECRVPYEPPTAERLEMAAWMIAHGSDIHQGGDGPLMRAALRDDRIPMMEVLVANGADVNAVWNGHYPIILAPCETLAVESLRWLLAHGANPALSPQYGDPLGMLVGTYSRDAAGKHVCLEVLAEHGYELPDTPVMALHRGRLDLLEAHLQRDPGLLARRFPSSEIFPPEFGLKPDEVFTWTPIAGTTLLHLAIEFDDLETAAWLIGKGVDVNARAAIDSEGFGGQTPLFHAVSFSKTTSERALLLLRNGADPTLRATFRKWFSDSGNPETDRMHEFRDVTAVEYAQQYPESQWVNEAAVAEIEAAAV